MGKGENRFRGIISSRKCSRCGQDEVGVRTSEGTFYPLKPGSMVEVIEYPFSLDHQKEEIADPEVCLDEKVHAQEAGKIWIPKLLGTDRMLRLKFGVFIDHRTPGGVTGTMYRNAFLKKLQHLIEKEIRTPLPVLLDQFFSAPHLATGNSRQVAESLWRELDEVRQPALLLQQWLETQDEEIFLQMIYPKTKKEVEEGNPVSDDQLTEELEMLSLEEFFGLLS